MRKKRIVVNDFLQRTYVCFLTEPVGGIFYPDTWEGDVATTNGRLGEHD